jgi:hypothetical protein
MAKKVFLSDRSMPQYDFRGEIFWQSVESIRVICIARKDVVIILHVQEGEMKL